jgi:5,10-methylenetetrahydromethanopterin reductase
MSELGFLVDGFSPAAAIGAQAQAAEAGGARRLWIACHLFQRDPVALASAALAVTRRIAVGLLAVSPYAIHPVHAAMAAATLDELFPGRVVLSLGVGAPADLAGAGIAAARPLRTLREAIAIARALLAGETVTHAGEVFRIAGRRLIGGGRPLPVMLAASGPQMLALAGAAADGVIVSGGASIPFVRWCLDHVAAGAPGGAAGGDTRTCEKIAIVLSFIAAREHDALDRARHLLGFVLRSDHHARNLEMAGLSLDQAALRAACAADDAPAVARLVGDDLVRSLTASGTAEQARARLAAYRAIGLDEIVLAGSREPGEIRETLERLQ